METENIKPAVLDSLIETLENPERHILSLLHSETNKSTTRDELVKTCRFLFQHIEELAKSYQSLTKDGDNKNAIPTILSGLNELFVPPAGEDGEVDAETIWGQVDLQNDALLVLLKKSVKRLTKPQEEICVLNMGEVLSDDVDDDDDDDEEGQSDDNNSDEQEKEKTGGDEEEEDEEEEEDDEEDEEKIRIRERMERAMEEMDSEEEEEEESDHEDGLAEKAKSRPKSQAKESLVDPAAEELNDGFFDINEMEEFADEEEEYLPDEAFGKPEKKKKSLSNPKSFHQRQREGGLESGSDDEEDEEDEEEFEDEEPIRRKKYREDDEIDALYGLYQEGKSDDEDDEDDEDDDIVNMTAADFFGKPNKKYYQQYKQKAPTKKPPVPDDDDSWGEYDFEKEDQTGWRDEQSDKAEKMESDDEDDNEDNADDNDDEQDEQVDKSEKKEDTSKFARQAQKLQRQTEQLEKEMLAEKPWQMTGEAKSKSRPLNSLLEGTPEFNVASKIAPTITVEHTADLEEVIKKRILAEDWDSVVPRELPDVGWHKKRGELPEVSQEKSKLGLGELYEREYLKKAVGYDVDAAEKETEEDKAKNEMKQLFANLCSKLDALSNYHFAPRPVADEADVRPVTTPAIAMEEVLPLHVSDARGVAPEEVYGAKRGREGVLRGESEMDQVRKVCNIDCFVAKVVNVADCTYSSRRRNESGCACQRRLLVARPARRNWQTRNSFPVSNLGLDSIIRTRSERFVRIYPWRDPEARLRQAKRISTPNLDQVVPFSNGCKLRLNNRYVINRMIEKKSLKRLQSRSQAHTNFNYSAISYCWLIKGVLSI
jgi:U3 small nucleolar RNA-associated protein MPP10